MMNKNKYLTLFLLILSLSLPGFAFAQSLASLPDDPAVSKGVLPDGISYYLVTNNTRKAVADLSLVWKTGFTAPADSSVSSEPVSADTLQSIARKCLSGTDVFGKRTPESFLRSNGVKCGKSGYIEKKGNAVVFNFKDINLSGGTAVIDSLLLLAFDMTRSCSAMLAERGHENCGQAIILSGDIAGIAVADKMKMLSLFVPDADRTEYTDTYSWALLFLQ